MDTTRVLITGGAGFIGAHTADALLARGHQVRVLDLLDPQIHGATPRFPTYLAPAVERVQGDVRKFEDVTAALEDIDVVLHCAALTGVGQSMYDIRDYVDTNCTGTATLIEAIVKERPALRRLVLSSSRAVYGEGVHVCPIHGPIPPTPRQRRDLDRGAFGVYCPQCGSETEARPTPEDAEQAPQSVYALTKQQQEAYCRYAADVFRLPVIALRYFNVFGSRQSLHNPYTGVVSIFFNRLRAKAPVSLYEHGAPLRDFVHVSDVARANVLAIENAGQRHAFACYNVGSGYAATIREVLESLSHAAGQEALTEDKGEFRVGDIHACYGNIDAARDGLGYEPQLDLAAGMREFVAWAQTQSSEDRYEQTVAELQQFGLFGQAGPEET
jgi:dTDP-L-rhamnose 4-epimerase